MDVLSKDNLVGHIRIDIFVDESKVDAVADAIMDAAHSDVPGADIVAVMPLEKFLHIRTRSATLPDES
jgi:nitrogen regulatory protein PII